MKDEAGQEIELGMWNRLLEEKHVLMKKLQEYEAKERSKERWQPHVELEKQLTYMYDCKRRLEDAAYYQNEAEDISKEFHLDLQTYGRACIWDAYADLEKQIEAKEKESLEMYQRLEEEE